MFRKKRVLALLSPFLLIAVMLVMFMDSTLAATAIKEHSAPLHKQTAESASVNDLPVCSGPPTKILPAGDSITLGEESSTDAGYRLPLYIALRNSGYDVDFVGSQSNGPAEPGFDDDHEGRPGWEIDQFFSSAPPPNDDGPITFWLNNQDPDVVLLHVGTNDMNGMDPVPQAIIDFDGLVDEIEDWEITNGISVTLVTAQIINQGCNESLPSCETNKGSTSEFNDHIGTVFTGIANRFVVDMENGAGIIYALEPAGDFSAEDDNPGIHPADSGYEKMAAVWYDQLVAVLPSPCNTDLLISPAASQQITAGVPFNYQVIASGYPTITGYSLTSAPAGMTIDAATGLISWLPGAEQAGMHTAVVEVTNGEETVSESYDIEVVVGDMAILQTPNFSYVLTGDSITMTVDITNTGSITLTTVPVEFQEAPSCNQNNVGPLANGQSTEVTCSFTPLDDMTFPVMVTATNALTEEIARKDVSTIDVIDPAIVVEKTTQTPVIFSGTMVTFTISITNSGDIGLTGIIVSDPDFPQCDNNSIGTIGVASNTSYTCQVANVTADFANTVYVTGTHPLGTVSDQDSASIDVIAPLVEISLAPDVQQILSGNNSNFTVTITNTGDTPLTNVTVIDSGTAVCDNTPVSLNPGNTSSYVCSDTNVTGDYIKEVTVTADHPIGQVTDSASVLVDVFNPNIDVVKTADTVYALTGTDVMFTITVTNTSGTVMDQIDINDPLGGCFDTTTTVAENASYQTSCTVTNATSDINNTVYVTGTVSSNSFSTSDLFVVDVIDPEISITVTPASQEVVRGTSATLEVTVENTGDIALTAVVVSGLDSTDCNQSVGTLAVAEQFTYSCTSMSLTEDLSILAEVIGTHPADGTVTASQSVDLVIKTFYYYLPVIIN